MKTKILLLVLLSALFLIPAYAIEDAEQGYIIKLNTDLHLDLYAETLSESEGVYRTDNQLLVESLDDWGVLDYCAKDETVYLFDYADDVTTLQNENWCRAMIGADYADCVSGTVVVGVIDSGVIDNFTDFSDAVMLPGKNYCVVETSDDRYKTTDSLGHGTFVTSILESKQAGIAHGLQIVPLKCFQTNEGSISNVVSAIYDAVNIYQCDVINLSCGIQTDNPALRDAVQFAYQNNVIMVAACGNLPAGRTSTGNDSPFYPAAYDEVIAVGAVDSNKSIAWFSTQNNSVWITAPGEKVHGLDYKSGTYKTGSGTSYASPVVCSAAALAKMVEPEITPEQFKALLQETSEDLGEQGQDNAYGHGLLNLGLLLATLTEDGASVIPSWYNGHLCLSAWLPENGVTWLAKYEQSGRFGGIEQVEGINNLEYDSNCMLIKVLTLGYESFAPMCEARSYGNGA